MILPLLLALTLGPAAPEERTDAYGDCQSRAKGTGFQTCLETALAEEDAVLNAAYRAVRERLDAARQRELRDRQRTWIRARDAACDSRAADQTDPALAAAARTDCLIGWTSDRVLWLENTYFPPEDL